MSRLFTEMRWVRTSLRTSLRILLSVLLGKKTPWRNGTEVHACGASGVFMKRTLWPGPR